MQVGRINCGISLCDETLLATAIDPLLHEIPVYTVLVLTICIHVLLI